ncbi:hypothetical protein OG426_48015 [Streptomyces canus]|nr:hypothetical protein OG426_48015 [Streptomyces canus]
MIELLMPSEQPDDPRLPEVIDPAEASPTADWTNALLVFGI